MKLIKSQLQKLRRAVEEKEIMTQPHINIGENILNKILADQIQGKFFKNHGWWVWCQEFKYDSKSENYSLPYITN